MTNLTLSTFRNLTDPAPTQITAAIEDWGRYFGDHYAQPYAAKDDVPGFSGTVWAPGHGRGKAGIAAIHAVTLDLDYVSPPDIERLVAPQLAGRACIAYSTWGHPTLFSQTGQAKLRLVLPLSRPVTLDEWPGLWRRVAHLFGGGVQRTVQGSRVEGSGLTDGKCKDASHFYYLPSQPQGSPQPQFLCQDGETINPDAILAGPDIPEITPSPTVERLLIDAREMRERGGKKGKIKALGDQVEKVARGASFAEQGGRNDSAWALACELAGRRYPHTPLAVLVAVFRRSVDAMASNDPEDALTIGEVSSMLARAREQVAADQRELAADREEITASFARVQGFQRMAQVEGGADCLAIVLSDNTSIFAGSPELRDSNEASLAHYAICRMGAPCVTAGGATWLYRPDLGVWRPLSDQDLYDSVHALEGLPHRGDGKGGVVKLGQRTIKSTIEMIRSVTGRAADWFLARPPGVAFDDGFVDGTLTPRPHDPCNRALHRVDGPFDRHAQAPTWSCTVREILAVSEDVIDDTGDVSENGDANTRAIETEDKVRALEEWVGVALLGEATRLNRALVLVGLAGTGKSTLGSAIAQLWPIEARASIQPSQFHDPVWAAELAGIGLNYLGEAQSDIVRDPSRIKAAITGDELMGAKKFQAPFKFRPIAAQLWNYNVLPFMLDDSSALAARLLVLRCAQVFRDTDRDDKYRAVSLRAEIAEIASRCLVAGACALRRGRHEVPVSSLREVKAWGQSSNPLREWTETQCERCERGEGATLDELHHAYRTWSEGLGRDRAIQTPVALGQRLRSMNYGQTQRQVDGQRVRRWNIRIKQTSHQAAIQGTFAAVSRAQAAPPAP